MTLLTQFSPPGYVQDFSDNPALQETMNAAWSGNVNRWVEAALVGDVWDMDNYGPRPAFYNPLVTDTPPDAVNAAIPWGAFPGRLAALFPNAGADWNQWADQGVPEMVTTNLCTQKTIPGAAYGPTGPRGWQDEYCEWSVTRNAAGKITSVMFTCENPEYWLTLWAVSPAKVLQLYQSLVSPAVQMQDLCLRDAGGTVVIDPATGQPAYNPLNQWNSGTVSGAAAGGAVHLTSSPNSLGAEFDLAAAATMPRALNGDPVTSAGRLVCFAKFGRIGRNSDPTIGQTVNMLTNYKPQLPKARATLTNPAGLYMQTPDFSNYTTPDGTPASEFWSVVRGTLANPGISGDIDRILHATFRVPADKNYEVGDILIDDANITYASQITATIRMALMATVFAGDVQQFPVGETVTSANPRPAVAALQSLPVFTAYRALELANKEDTLSIPILAFALAPGQSMHNVALLLNNAQTLPGASFTVPEGGVSIEVTGTQAMPPAAQMSVYLVTVTASADARPGDRSILASVPGMAPTDQPALGLLTITAGAAVTLPKPPARPAFRSGRA